MPQMYPEKKKLNPVIQFSFNSNPVEGLGGIFKIVRIKSCPLFP